jgi:hypothetical protein
MKPCLITGTLALGLVCLLPAAEAKSSWHTDYAGARQLARQTGKPLFVVFRCEH